MCGTAFQASGNMSVMQCAGFIPTMINSWTSGTDHLFLCSRFVLEAGADGD